MNLEKLKEKPLWQMTGEEFLFLQQNGTEAMQAPPPLMDTTLKNMFTA